jgi:hypothetical protein
MRVYEILREDVPSIPVMKTPDGEWEQRDNVYVFKSTKGPVLSVMVDSRNEKVIFDHNINRIRDSGDIADYLNKNLAPLAKEKGWRFELDHHVEQDSHGDFVNMDKTAVPKVVLPLPGYGEWATVPMKEFLEFHSHREHIGIPDQYTKPANQVYFLIHDVDKKDGRRRVGRGTVVVENNRVVYTDTSGSLLKRLLDYLKPGDSGPSKDIHWNEIIIRNGEIRSSLELLKGKELLRTPEMIVYEVPPGQNDIIYAHYRKRYSTADKLIFVKITPGGHCIFAIKNGEVVGKSSMKGISAHATDQIEKQLVAIPELGLEKSKSRLVRHNGAIHRTLSYIDQNPGTTRTDIYLKGLGRHTGTVPNINDTRSPDGLALASKLIREVTRDGKQGFEITSAGKFVLAVLNSGKSVPVDSLLKSK